MKVEKPSYLAAGAEIADFLGFDKSVGTSVVKDLVGFGVLSKSSGRMIQAPTFDGLVKLDFGIAARANGVSKKSVVAFVMQCELEDPGLPYSRLHGPRAWLQCCDTSLTIKLPRGTADFLMTIYARASRGITP